MGIAALYEGTLCATKGLSLPVYERGITYRRGTWVLLAGTCRDRAIAICSESLISRDGGHDALRNLRNIVRIVQSTPIGKDILKRKGDEL